MKKRFRKQLSILLIAAMVFSSGVSVYADEVRDNTGVPENEAVTPQDEAQAEAPAVSEPEPGETAPQTPAAREEGGAGEILPDDGDEETVSEGDTLPVEEDTGTAEETAGSGSATEDWLKARIAEIPASGSGTITLSEDITLTECLVIDGAKNITLDLRGNDITGTGSVIDGINTKITAAKPGQELMNKFLISVQDENTKLILTDSSATHGKITYTDALDYASVIAVWNKATLSADNVSLEAYNSKKAGVNALKSGGKAIMAVGAFDGGEEKSTVILNSGLKITDAYMGIYAIGKGATVIANDGVEVNGKNTAFQNFGQPWTFGTDITINGGTYRAFNSDNDGTAVYYPGAGKLTINGGYFEGDAGIEISNGDVYINGGVISANTVFATNINAAYIANGSTSTGCGICYSPYTDSNLNSSLNIVSGNILGAYGLFINYRDGSDSYFREHIKINVTGGRFESINKVGKAFGVLNNPVLTSVISDITTLKGGAFNTKPGDDLVSDGYGAVLKDGFYEVIKRTLAFMRPVMAQDVVFEGQSLEQAGLKTILVDETGKVINDATVTGDIRYFRTDQTGAVSGSAIDISASCNEPGTYYLAVSKNGLINISENGMDMTGYYTIGNADRISVEYLLKYTVEEIKDEDELTIVQKREVCYSEKVESAYDFFEVSFLLDGNKLELGKTSGVKFYWNGSGSPSDAFDCSSMPAGTNITVNIEYLGKTAGTAFMIQRLPVYVEGAATVTSLVGDELSERYYGLINVYNAGDDRNTKTGIIVREKVQMSDWFDCTSSVIDLTGITNARKGSYKAVLKDAGRLTNENDISKNYELIEKAYINYNVDPSLIIDFLEPSRETELAPTKIRRADDNTDLLIYSFANKQSTLNATWCVKTVSYNGVEQSWEEEMVDASSIGIMSTPIANNYGTKFSFSQEFLTSIAEEGGRYTLYEVFTEDMEYKDEGNLSLTVKAVPPVVYNGNRFVAKDDSRYYSKGVAKSGYSPVLDISVWDGKNRLHIGTDYELAYKNNKNAGNKDSDNVPTVTVKGLGLYSAMKINVPITILAADLSRAANVAVTTQYVKYNGKTLKPKLKVTYRSGVNAGKVIPASAYDITILDSEGKDVTQKNFKKSQPFALYTAVITANGSNPNITGSISQIVKKTENDGTEEKEDIFFYGIPKSSSKLKVGGTLSKVVYPITVSTDGIEAFIDKDKFYAKTSERKFFYDDVADGTVSVDLVDGTDECTQTVFDINDTEALNSGVYYLRTQLTTDELKAKYYAFEPTYTKVTYAGTKLKTEDVKLKKKSFDFSSEDEFTSLTLKLSNRIKNKGTDGIRLYVYQNGSCIEVSELAEEGYEINGSELENNKAGRYRIRVEGSGAYYGSYDLTYTVGVQAYNKDKTPVAAFVNTASEEPDDETETAVHYRPDGDYPDELVKVVWTKADGSKVVLKPRSTSGNNAGEGDYYIKWGNFKQVGPKKGTVTIVGMGTYFTGKFKKKFDVDQAE